MGTGGIDPVAERGVDHDGHLDVVFPHLDRVADFEFTAAPPAPTISAQYRGPAGDGVEALPAG